MKADTLVSARIPSGKKEAAASVLATLGATTSDLINSAFDYILEKKELPKATTDTKPSKTDLIRYLEESSLPIEWGTDASDGDYRELLHTKKRDAYESLA